MFIFIRLIFLQSSALWMRLLLVPFCLTVLIRIINSRARYGWVILLYSIIFIGGLLVLLVSVSSLTSYERAPLINIWWSFLPTISLFFLRKRIYEENYKTNTIWIKSNGELLILALNILVVAILLISWQNNLNKIISRSI